MSRFVAALLQGLNCLAIPPGVGPFHSVFSFRVEDKFFNPLNIEYKKASYFVSPDIVTEIFVIASPSPPTNFSIQASICQVVWAGKRFPR
ncbi:hypothetical protein CXF77_06720 [Planococcus sp. MB-3u-09]|nr:hypothetical protein CXF66_15895 [Planococcus sp. Urea-trap-24]PKG87041.1 hypothetical protein CXF91_13565 [Planococcus sp. Urea-3u-39]PKH41095.1 hypothetical protein CXF77_06720 [Planococcus sp. MB-3u-09]